MENLDIFNLDGDTFITKSLTEQKDLDFYKPYPENGKDGVYKALIRFVPNVTNPAKSKIQKYYVYLNDPISGDAFSVDCPTTVGKKSILKDLYWKLKNSHSAADQELSKSFSRKEDFYTLIQVIQDKNKPEYEGKIMLFKFGKKLNDLIEAQIEPEYGETCNPYNLFEGREFSLQVRKVGDWNNYDLCNFIGERSSIKIDGKVMEKNKEDMGTIQTYLTENSPKNLDSFDYKDWDDDMLQKVSKVIRNTVPDARTANDVLGSVNNESGSINNVTSTESTTASDFTTKFESVTQQEAPAPVKDKVTSTSLDDLYSDL